jgi:hypothetical protein
VTGLAVLSRLLLFLLETIGHVTLSTGIELLAIGTATVHPTFDRYAANESTFIILATLACFIIIRSQELNHDCFDEALIVRVSFISLRPSTKLISVLALGCFQAS